MIKKWCPSPPDLNDGLDDSLDNKLSKNGTESDSLNWSLKSEMYFIGRPVWITSLVPPDSYALTAEETECLTKRT